MEEGAYESKVNAILLKDKGVNRTKLGMNAPLLVCVVALCIAFPPSCVSCFKRQPIIDDKVLIKLKQVIAKNQVQETTQFKYPYTMYKQKGTYSSYIHENLQGGPDIQALRNTVKFYDVNVFVTAWVTSVLLEVHRFEGSTTPALGDIEDQLMEAISAISDYHDKNMPNSSLVVFWPQTYNTTTKVWSCAPVNLEGVVKADEKITDYVHRLLKDAGLEYLWDKIAPFIHFFVSLTKAFYIPKDFDDTFINIGLGNLLKDVYNSNSSLYKKWLSNNQNLQGVLDVLKKYAYRPFSSEVNSNIIDPRTYFYLRDFIYNSQSRNESLALVSTWILNLAEDKVSFYKGVTMPFHLNNVDLTVSANTLYGLTAALLGNLITEDQFDEDIQMIYENTTAVIAWEISHNFSSRPDLALTYYPSVYTFLWFTSRTLNLLNRFDQLPLPVLSRVRSILTTVMKDSATNYILDRMKTQHDGLVYLDDFLGDGDKDIFGIPVNHADDRICSTSMAVNALFYTWAPNGTFTPDTNDTVKAMLSGSCDWLNRYTLSGKYKPMNAFFSGSVKDHYYDIPFFYPANVNEFLNGTQMPSDYVLTIDSVNIIVGMSGVIPSEEYKKMLTQKFYGSPVPLDFPGFEQSVFPFWSSEPFTYASALLALTQCKTVPF